MLCVLVLLVWTNISMNNISVKIKGTCGHGWWWLGEGKDEVSFTTEIIWIMQLSYACRCFHFQYMQQINVRWIKWKRLRYKKVQQPKISKRRFFILFLFLQLQHLLSQGRWVLQAVWQAARSPLTLDWFPSRRGLQEQVASSISTWVSTSSAHVLYWCCRKDWSSTYRHYQVLSCWICTEIEHLPVHPSDRVKAEMDLKELSETVQQQQQQNQQQQGGSAALTTPKRPIRSLDKTIESCKAQLGTRTIILYYFFGTGEYSCTVDIMLYWF